MAKGAKVIVVGLDGATWDLIRPWAREEKLPTFKKLMNESAWGKLESTMPPVTAPAWASFLTGKSPSKTGIYDFLYVKEKFPPKVGVSSGFMIKGSDLLTIMSDEGFKVVSINIPMTYPPYEVNGSLVSGIETPDGKKFAYPDNLYKKLVEEDYFPEPGVSYLPGKEKEYLNELYLMIEKRNRLLFNFLDKEDFDLLLFLFRETDVVTHTFWRYMDENHPFYPAKNQFKDTILDIYKKADELLKKVLERKDEKTLLIVMSDHGFGAEYYRINLNNWLIRKGYISLKKDLKINIKKLINHYISPAKAWSLVNKLGIRIIGEVKKKQSRINGQGLVSKLFVNFNDIDWKQTEVYSIGCVGRHLPVFVKNRKSDTKLEEIKRDILSINEYLGKRIVTQVINTKNCYTKSTGKILPDLFVEFTEPYAGYTLPPPYLSEGSSILSKSPITQSGAHKSTGILIVAGGGVKRGKLDSTNIMDIAPTLLVLFGIKSPEDMDGRILTEIVGDVACEYVEEKERIKRTIRRLSDKL